jgi:hypothetical protein
MHRRLAATALFILAACQPKAGVPPSGETLPAPWPAFDFQAEAGKGGPVYSLDTDSSRIEIVVRRAGPLARFGHDHVVVASDLQGFLLLADNGSASRAELRVPLDRMKVDPAEARSRYRLDTDPDAEDIAATRENMLREVLQAGSWPYASLELQGLSQEGGKARSQVRIDIAGVSSEHPVAFDVVTRADIVRVVGHTILSQEALGLEPFSVLGGGLSVADQIEVHFDLQGSGLP